MTYYLIVWMFICPNFSLNHAWESIWSLPTFIESTTYISDDWEKSRHLKECPNGLAVWAKPQKVTKVEQEWKPVNPDKDGSATVLTEEIKTVVYERK